MYVRRTESRLKLSELMIGAPSRALLCRHLVSAEGTSLSITAACRDFWDAGGTLEAGLRITRCQDRDCGSAVPLSFRYNNTSALTGIETHAI